MESFVLILMFSPSLVFLVNLDGSERERAREREVCGEWGEIEIGKEHG